LEFIVDSLKAWTKCFVSRIFATVVDFFAEKAHDGCCGLDVLLDCATLYGLAKEGAASGQVHGIHGELKIPSSNGGFFE
jgi:hypothetical protein